MTQLPKISFLLDPTFTCRVSASDQAIVAFLRDTYGVEVVDTEAALHRPGSRVKFLPDLFNPWDGLMQVPQAVFDEAKALLPTFAAHYDTSNPEARGTSLLRRAVNATQTPLPTASMTLRLYVCPDLNAAYSMTHWPFYPYLTSVYSTADQAKRWSERDWTDWYMLHELLHWYTFDQPFLRRWTATLERVHRRQVANDPLYLSGSGWMPATTANDCRDAYPAFNLNMNNLLSHLHLNGLRRTVLEPAAWEYVKTREKTVTGDANYARSIDVVEAMSAQELATLIAEVSQTRVPPNCITFRPDP